MVKSEKSYGWLIFGVTFFTVIFNRLFDTYYFYYLMAIIFAVFGVIYDNYKKKQSRITNVFKIVMYWLFQAVIIYIVWEFI